MTTKQSEPISGVDGVDYLKSIRINEIENISDRIKNSLYGMNFIGPRHATIFEVLNFNPKNILLIRNFGKKSLNDLKKTLKQLCHSIEVNPLEFPLFNDSEFSDFITEEDSMVFILRKILEKLDRVFPENENEKTT